jgi:hypothetical protein
MTGDIMSHSIENILSLRTMPKTIEAACYNQARLALLRLGNPLRVSLPDHRGLVITIHNNCWVCVDSFRDDQLIMVWQDFDTRKHNAALHEPVYCQLRLYHMQAGLIMGSALDALQQALAEMIADISRQDAWPDKGL